MFKFLKTLVSRLAPPTKAQQELAYLQQAVSRIDLERRQREIDQGLFRPTGFAF